VTFRGAAGDRLAGLLERPSGTVRAYALSAHCFTSGKDVRAAAVISRALAKEHIGVLRFDFTGPGSGDGDLANTTFSTNVADIVAAVGAPFHAAHVRNLLAGDIDAIECGGVADVSIGGRMFRIRRGFSTTYATAAPRRRSSICSGR